jgi:hypothetical protein
MLLPGCFFNQWLYGCVAGGGGPGEAPENTYVVAPPYKQK